MEQEADAVETALTAQQQQLQQQQHDDEDAWVSGVSWLGLRVRQTLLVHWHTRDNASPTSGFSATSIPSASVESSGGLTHACSVTANS